MTELDRIFDNAWRQTMDVIDEIDGIGGTLIIESARRHLQIGMGSSDVSTVAAYLTIKSLIGAGWIVKMPEPIPEGNR